MAAKQGRSPRILITRLSHIGDCVLTLPLACAIKRAYPDSTIAWTVESPTQKLLAGHACIDEMITIPKGLASRPQKWFGLAKKLRPMQFDISIDPQSLTKSSLIGKLSGAKTRLGFASPYGRELSKFLNSDFIDAQHEHLVDRTLDFLSHESLRVEDRSVEFRLPIPTSDQLAMSQYLASKETGAFVTINPGASWASKRWLPKRFGFVARYAMHSFSMRSVVTWAGEEELAMAKEIVSVSEGSAILAPPTTLGQLAALYEKAEVFIGCDTGPLHIAAATGTRCVGLYGPTLPTRSGAYGNHHVAVQSWHQSDRNRKRAANLAMQDISVDDVCVALDKVFAKRVSRFAA